MKKLTFLEPEANDLLLDRGTADRFRDAFDKIPSPRKRMITKNTTVVPVNKPLSWANIRGTCAPGVLNRYDPQVILVDQTIYAHYNNNNRNKLDQSQAGKIFQYEAQCILGLAMCNGSVFRIHLNRFMGLDENSDNCLIFSDAFPFFIGGKNSRDYLRKNKPGLLIQMIALEEEIKKSSNRRAFK